MQPGHPNHANIAAKDQSHIVRQDPKGIRWSWLAELQRRAVDIVRHLTASDNLLPR